MALSTDFMPFIFGGNTGETLESIARKRAVAEALLARGGTPKNVGEGLTAVGNALASVILERRAAAGQKAGEAGVDPSGIVGKWLSGGDLDEITGGGPSPVPGAPAAPAPGVAPPTPAWSPRNPPPATENVPAGWGAGGNFAPPAGAAPPASSVGTQPTGFSGSKQAFIDMLMPAAVELSKKTGLDPGLIIGQAALESGWGRHAPGGNYFGVKSHGMPGGQTLRTTEYAGGQPHAENASFRTYSGPEASVRGYGDFLQQNPRYGPMLKAQGLDAQLAALAKSGYATDPNYVYGPIDPATGRPRDPNAGVAGIARRISAPQGGPTQVASLDPSIGLPLAPTGVQTVASALPGGGPPAPSPGVATVAAALQGSGGAPAGPEMASAAPFPMGGASGLAPPFVPPSVPTGIQSGRPTPMMPTQALSPSAPLPRPAGAPPPAMGGGVPQAVVQKALEVLNHPFSNAVQKAQALEVLKMAQQQRDPAYQMGLEKSRLELDALRNKPPERQVINGVLVERGADGGWKPVYTAPPEAPKPTTDIQNFEYGQSHPGFTPAAREKIGDVLYERQSDGGWKAVTPAAAPGGMFGGTSVEAQGLNYLVQTGQLTKDQAAQLAAGKTITGPNGEILFLTPQGVFGSAGGATAAPYAAPAPGAGPAPSPAAGNFGPGVIPITPPAKPTDAQLTTATYADRLLNAGPIIDQFEKAGLDWTNYAKADIPGWLAGGGNALIPPEFRQLAQAQRSFINAVLRRESGAVISEQEFENARKQYFPQPGDDAQTLANKRKEREIATAGFVRAAGPAYKPPAPTPAAAPSAVPFVAPKVGSPLSPGTYEWDPVTNSLRPAQ